MIKIEVTNYLRNGSKSQDEFDSYFKDKVFVLSLYDNLAYGYENIALASLKELIEDGAVIASYENGLINYKLKEEI